MARQENCYSKNSTAYCVVLACVFFAALFSKPQTEIILRHANVLPMDSPRILRDYAVRIAGEEIVSLSPESEPVKASEGAITIDCKGGYLLPGLVDMHTHVQNPNEFLLYAAYGVTTCVNLGGPPKILDWRKQLRAGELLGPDFFCTPWFIRETSKPDSHTVPLASPNDAEGLVLKLKGEGYDLLKIKPPMSAGAYKRLVEAAHANGLIVAGHIPRSFPFDTILDPRLDIIAHSEEIFYSYFGDKVEEARVPEMVSKIKKAGIAVIPTLGYFRTILKQAEDLPAVLNQPDFAYLSPNDTSEWMPGINPYASIKGKDLAEMKHQYAFMLTYTKALYDAGVPIFTGSDSQSQGGIPGLSEHEELRDAITMGLSPFQALQTATTAPGQFIAQHLHPSLPFGEVAPGMRADLVLVKNNPLVDVTYVKKPVGVMLRGRWFLAKDLTTRLAAVKRTYDSIRARLRNVFSLCSKGKAVALPKAKAMLESGDLGNAAMENYLNGFGYKMIADKKTVGTGVAGFEVATELFPNSFNAFDSLGDGYSAAGRNLEAISAYRESLQLNPKNSHAADRIKELGGSSTAARATAP